MDNETPRTDSKIAVVLRDDLQGWQRLNVCAFVAGALAAANPDAIGEPYADADGTPYLAMFGQPVVVLAGDRDTLRAAHSRAVARGVPVAVFTAELFDTGNDADNRAAVRAVAAADLDLVGIALRARRNVVDKVVKGARMHP